MTHHLHDLKLRAHVVLRLGCELIERSRPSFSSKASLEAIKERYAALVRMRYPITQEEAATPEAERAGIVPLAVYNAIERRKPSGDRRLENKHATPADVTAAHGPVFKHVRPVSCTPSAGQRRQKSIGDERACALQRPENVVYQTDIKMMDQWNRGYPAAAWPFAFNFQCGGPDYPRGHANKVPASRARALPLVADKEASLPQPVNVGAWVAGVSRRVEAQIRGDWTLIPALRNIWFRFSAVSSHLIAGTYKSKEETNDEFAERLVAAVQKLSRLLTTGVYGPDRRPIAGDITKLPAAHDLTREERAIARNVCAVTSALSGCQQIRRQMGHIFESTTTMHGHGLFLTISPNERQSSLTLRFSRFRTTDPLLDMSDDPCMRKKMACADAPSLFLPSAAGFGSDDGGVEVDLPGFDFRREILAKDPHCASLGIPRGSSFAISQVAWAPYVQPMPRMRLLQQLW